MARPVREGFLEEVTSKRRSGMGQETAYKWGWGRALQEEGRAEAWALCAIHPSSPGPTWKGALESSLCPGLGSGFSEVVSVGAEHRPDFITTVAMISSPQGEALWTPLGGFRVHGGGDRGAWQREGYEGLGAGQGIVGGEERLPPRLVEGLAPCLAGSAQLAGRRGTGLPGRDPGLWAAQ